MDFKYQVWEGVDWINLA